MESTFRLKRGLVGLFVICLIVSGFSLLSTSVEAGTSDNVSGWAWSSNIGWLNFNCDDSKGSSGLNTCGSNDFGVRINEATGDFSGYAWSSNVGWINFNPAPESGSGCSAAPCNAKVNWATGVVTGWVRACTVFQSGCSGALKPAAQLGGWDGWIKMDAVPFSAASPETSGVNLNLATNQFRGFAWGSEVMGWINFAPALPQNVVVRYDGHISVDLVATDETPDWNTSTDLTWTVTGNPTVCTASGDWIGNKNIAGGTESTGNLIVSKTYTITCTGPAGSGSDTVTVTPNLPPPPVITIKACDLDTSGESTCSEGTKNITTQEVEIRWTSTGSRCFAINNPLHNFSTGNQSNGIDNSVNEPLAGFSHTFTVECENLVGVKDRKSVVVTKNPTSVTPMLEVSRERGRSNETYELYWNTNGADPATCSITGGDINVTGLPGAVRNPGEDLGPTDDAFVGKHFGGKVSYTLSCPSNGTDSVSVELIGTSFEG